MVDNIMVYIFCMKDLVVKVVVHVAFVVFSPGKAC